MGREHCSGMSSHLPPSTDTSTGGCPNQSPVCLIHSQPCKRILSWSGEAVLLQPARVLSGEEEEDEDERDEREDEEEEGEEGEEEEGEGRECPCHSSLLFEHFVKVFCITLLG